MNTLGFSFGNLKPFSVAQVSTLLRHLWSRTSILFIFFLFIKDTEIIYIQRRVGIVNTFKNVIDFDIKEGRG